MDQLTGNRSHEEMGQLTGNRSHEEMGQLTGNRSHEEMGQLTEEGKTVSKWYVYHSTLSPDHSLPALATGPGAGTLNTGVDAACCSSG